VRLDRVRTHFVRSVAGNTFKVRTETYNAEEHLL
jgi:hypothetical protein